MLKTVEKKERCRILRVVPGWLYRLLFSALLGGITLATIVPWAAEQRGYSAFGGEYLVVLAVFVLPFCIFRSQ